MSASTQRPTNVDLSDFQDCQLKTVAQELQHYAERLEGELCRIKSDLSETSMEPRRPSVDRLHRSKDWIIANNGSDFIDDNSNILLFDGRDFSVKNYSDLSDINVVSPIFSKIPSKFSSKLYVYSDPSPYSPTDSSITVRSKRTHNDNLRWRSTIYLNKMPRNMKMQVLTGRIKHLFIMDNGRTSTNSSSESD
jgi:hypothetical protein